MNTNACSVIAAEEQMQNAVAQSGLGRAGGLGQSLQCWYSKQHSALDLLGPVCVHSSSDLCVAWSRVIATRRMARSRASRSAVAPERDLQRGEKQTPGLLLLLDPPCWTTWMAASLSPGSLCAACWRMNGMPCEWLTGAWLHASVRELLGGSKSEQQKKK